MKTARLRRSGPRDLGADVNGPGVFGQAYCHRFQRRERRETAAFGGSYRARSINTARPALHWQRYLAAPKRSKSRRTGL